jgi:hypothetical protein
MYQTLIWPTVLRYEARGLGAPFNAEDLKRLADALIDRVRRDFQFRGNLFRRQMLVDEAQAIELARAQPLDPLLDSFCSRQAAWPPIAVRQAVPNLPSDVRPAQHSR